MVVWLIPHVMWGVHGTGISTLDIFRATSRPLLVAIVAVALAYVAGAYFVLFQSPVFNLVLASSVMATAYSGLMIATGRDFYLDLLKSFTTSSPQYQEDDLAPSLSLPPK
jgi:PST family polysaccharide transporter